MGEIKQAIKEQQIQELKEEMEIIEQQIDKIEEEIKEMKEFILITNRYVQKIQEHHIQLQEQVISIYKVINNEQPR